MDEKNNVIGFKKDTTDKVFGAVGTGIAEKKSHASNPVVQKFIKYFSSSKGKFSIKDIFR